MAAAQFLRDDSYGHEEYVEGENAYVSPPQQPHGQSTSNTFTPPDFHNRIASRQKTLVCQVFQQ